MSRVSTLMAQTKNSFKQFPEPDNVTMTILSQKNSFWWKGVAKWFCCLFCIHIQRKGAQPPLLSRVALSQAWWWLLLWHWYCWHLYSCGLQCHVIEVGKYLYLSWREEQWPLRLHKNKSRAVLDPRFELNFSHWWLGIVCLVSTSFLGQPFFTYFKQKKLIEYLLKYSGLWYSFYIGSVGGDLSEPYKVLFPVYISIRLFHGSTATQIYIFIFTNYLFL